MAGFQGHSTRGDDNEGYSALVETERRDIQTTVTGTIVSYDPRLQIAEIQPHMRQRFGDQTLNAPVLQRVPVRQPRGGGFNTHAPIKAGDEVTLHFQQRSADPWRVDGQHDDQRAQRMHDLSDAIAVPGSTREARAAQNMPADRFHAGRDDGSSGYQVGTDGAIYIKVAGEDRVRISADGKKVEILESVDEVKASLGALTFKARKSPPRVDIVRGNKDQADNKVLTEGGPSDLLWADI